MVIKRNKSLEKSFLTVILFISFFLPTFGQEDTTIEEVSDNPQVLAEEIEELDEKEEERETEKANLLGITLPEYTDNPSYVITFTDPSSEKVGVEIELDGKDFTQITSPYTFPALSIGEHSMRFRFTDENGQVQLLEHKLIIIPRAPVVTSPVIDETSVVIQGTALSNSEIIYRLNNNAFNITEIITSDGSGNWSVTFAPESGLSDGIYTFTAYTRKYGYASNLSDSVVFAVGDVNQELLKENDTPKDIFFSFSEINSGNIKGVVKDNMDLLYLTLGSFVLGGFLFTLIKTLISGHRDEKKNREVEKIITKDSNKEGKEKTLKELFGGDKEESKEKEKEDKGKKKKEEEKIINKDMFLKEFKHVDPDDEKGNERLMKDVKKKIKVSLTSKEES
jgi:hypothetical protein